MPKFSACVFQVGCFLMSKISTIVMPDTGVVCVTSNGRSGHLPGSATPEEINAFGATLGRVGTIVGQESSALSACLMLCSDVAERLHGDEIRPVADDGSKLDEADVLPSFYSGPQLSKCRTIVDLSAWVDRTVLFSMFTTLDPCYRFASAVGKAVRKNPSREDAIRAAIQTGMTDEMHGSYRDAEFSKAVLKSAATLEAALVKTAKRQADTSEVKSEKAKKGRRLVAAEPAAVADLVADVSLANDSSVQMVAMVECYRAKSMEERASMFCFYSDLVGKFEALDIAESGS